MWYCQVMSFVPQTSRRRGLLGASIHTRIRRDYRINVNRSKTAGLDAFLRHCFRNRPRQYHNLHDGWFWKQVVIFENAIYYKKGTEKSCISVPLNFLSHWKEQLPQNWESCSGNFIGERIQQSQALREGTNTSGKNGAEVYKQERYIFSIHTNESVSSF